MSVSDKVTEINCHIYRRDAGLSPCAVMLGLLYMHRLVHKKPNYLTTTCSRDLFLASMVGTLLYCTKECYVCYSFGY